MKHISYLLLLPMVALVAIAFTACSGLTDEEQKFIGEWSSETYQDSLIDEDMGIRMIYTAYDHMIYHEDYTYDDEMYALIKMEFPFNDGPVRLYWYYHGKFKNSWSVSNGVYSDSIIAISLLKDEVAPNNVVASRDRNGELVRFGIKNFPKSWDRDVVNGLKETYNETTKGLNEIWNSKSKSTYSIVSISDNAIVYKDNEGEKTTLRKGKVVSPRVQQMLSEGIALR